jgi:hypothetical protein
VFHYCFKQQYSTKSRDKPGSSDASDADINQRDVLRWQSRKFIYNVRFLNKLSPVMNVQKRIYRKRRNWLFRLVVQAVYIQYRGFVGRLRYRFDKRVYRFTSPRKKRNMQNQVTNLDDFDKDIPRRAIFRFCDKAEFPTAKKLALELRDKLSRFCIISVQYFEKHLVQTQENQR